MKDNAEVYKQITGEILLTRSDSGGTPITTATWKGGDVVALSKEFVDQIATNDIDGINATKHGSFITVCDFKVQIFDYYQDLDLYLAKRVN